MLIILNKYSNKEINNMGTNSKNPDGNNIPYELKDNEKAVKVHDKSKLAKQITEAFDYDLVLAGNAVIGVNVKKTKKEHENEKPPKEKGKTISEEIEDIKKRLDKLEVGH